MKVLGAGGDGIVFLDLRDPERVTKAIYRNNQACSKARTEYDKQQRIYECLQCLYQCDDDPLVNLIKQYVRIAKPISFTDAPVDMNGIRYECAFSMTRLNQLPMLFYDTFDRGITRRIEPHYKEQLGGLMAHLSFNSPISGVFGIKFSSANITRENPPRGYFSNAETGFFDFLRREYGFSLSDEALQRIMAFMYGWIYFKCDIIPLDIEFTLGFNQQTRQIELNVLDFGMTFDKRAPRSNMNAFETRRFLSIYGSSSNTSLLDRETALLERVLDDTGLDLYLALDEGSEARATFMSAQNLGACSQCKKLTFFVHPTSKRFLCSHSDCFSTANLSY